MRESRLILPGFYPDPSICRKGRDYYIANSSFGYFPGVPIHHSTDLLNWTLIGHVLDRPEQLPLAGAGITDGGIYAPSLRYHNGKFWMITTNVSNGGHFFCTADDPTGPWSDPIWIDTKHQGGIDPDLFWDDDGSCWISCTRNDRKPDVEPHHGIWQFRVDPANGQGLTKRRFIWGGSGGKSPEGPHLFKRGKWYYLLVAEGGTEYCHMATVARSSSPNGPWESCPHNPILTHRSINSNIQSLGHSDWIEDADGNWWTVFLGVRPCTYPFTHHLGRETFIAPMDWTSDGWPVVNDGKPISIAPLPGPQAKVFEFRPGMDVWRDFCCVRDPLGVKFSLDERPGWLSLRGRRHGLDAGRPAPELMSKPIWQVEKSFAEFKEPISFLGIRQRHFNIKAGVTLDYTPSPGSEAGIAAFMSERCHYAICLRNHDGNRVAALVKRVLDMDGVTYSEPLPDGQVVLEITADRSQYKFAVGDSSGRRHELGTGLAKLLSTEVAGGFTGVFLGLYAVDPADGAGAPANFAKFSYEPNN